MAAFIRKVAVANTKKHTMRTLSLPLIAALVGGFVLVIFAAPKAKVEPKSGPIRVLFLGHTR